MYPLNTILTFTSLTHASAAADLFGRSSLESLLSAEDLGLSLFDKRVFDDHMAWEPGFFPDAEQWRIILDTPEKVRWFEPQVGDDFSYGGGVSTIREIRGDRILHGRGIIDRSDIRKIIYRGEDKPFPQPQDAKLPEESKQ
jgi:hypothetical protein